MHSEAMQEDVRSRFLSDVPSLDMDKTPGLSIGTGEHRPDPSANNAKGAGKHMSSSARGKGRAKDVLPPLTSSGPHTTR